MRWSNSGSTRVMNTIYDSRDDPTHYRNEIWFIASKFYFRIRTNRTMKNTCLQQHTKRNIRFALTINLTIRYEKQLFN